MSEGVHVHLHVHTELHLILVFYLSLSLSQRHFINIINSAQSHVRRNELWKRLLYGGGGNKIVRK